jgi:hypothetical protein
MYILFNKMHLLIHFITNLILFFCAHIMFYRRARRLAIVAVSLARLCRSCDFEASLPRLAATAALKVAEGAAFAALCAALKTRAR